MTTTQATITRPSALINAPAGIFAVLGLIDVALTGVIAIVVTVWMMRERRLAEIVPLALILGGALGNIRDRVQLGYVVGVVAADADNFHGAGKGPRRRAAGK